MEHPVDVQCSTDIRHPFRALLSDRPRSTRRPSRNNSGCCRFQEFSECFRIFSGEDQNRDESGGLAVSISRTRNSMAGQVVGVPVRNNARRVESVSLECWATICSQFDVRNRAGMRSLRYPIHRNLAPAARPTPPEQSSTVSSPTSLITCQRWADTRASAEAHERLMAGDRCEIKIPAREKSIH